MAANSELAERLIEHLVQRFGTREVAIDAAMCSVAFQISALHHDYAEVTQMTGAGALLFENVMALEDRARGRKLTNEAKRAKLAALAELLRDTADRLDRLCL